MKKKIKKNVDSRLPIDNSVKNWSETERIESRLSPPEQKCLDPGQEGWNDIYIYTPYMTPHTPLEIRVAEEFKK